MKEQEMKALSHSLASDDGDKDTDKNSKSQLSAGNPNPISNKTNNDSDNQSKALASTSVSLWDTISDFRHSGCMGVMLAYSFLYFTVLSFGAMMTVYLRWAGTLFLSLFFLFPQCMTLYAQSHLSTHLDAWKDVCVCVSTFVLTRMDS